MGFYLGKACLKFDFSTRTKNYWPFLGCLIFILCMSIHAIFVHVLKIDLDWTLAYADKFCNNSAWVHKSTNPVTTVYKLLGCCLGMYFYKVERHNGMEKIGTLARYIFCAICVGLFYGLYYVQAAFIDANNHALFYGTSALHYFLVPVVLSLF